MFDELVFADLRKTTKNSMFGELSFRGLTEGITASAARPADPKAEIARMSSGREIVPAWLWPIASVKTTKVAPISIFALLSAITLNCT
ncbi:hypothetical protein [Sphingopyxis sp. BSNA05]|uniref:hypothetical protein n=1 Tax=Sphingopyxis sp. BSNA05 TaxID=1236614 RepID=UPI0020B8AD46|nr:hypothetical protein [Sphingopyxis sp. BSNA05]